MAPSCGHCLGPDCGGDPGFTDPDCPEHGKVARAAYKAKLAEEVERLSRHTLCLLTRGAKPQSADIPFDLARFREEETPQEIIRRKSEHMLSAARSGNRRLKLFRIYLSGTQEPEEGLSELQQEVCQHFKERKISIVFRENWDSGHREFGVYATW